MRNILQRFCSLLITLVFVCQCNSLPTAPAEKVHLIKTPSNNTSENTIILNVGNSHANKLQIIGEQEDPALPGFPNGIYESGQSSYNTVTGGGDRGLEPGSHLAIGDSERTEGVIRRGNGNAGVIQEVGSSLKNNADLKNGFNGNLSVGSTKNVRNNVYTSDGVFGKWSGSIYDSGVSNKNSYVSAADRIRQEVNIGSSENSRLSSATNDPTLFGPSGSVLNHGISKDNFAGTQ